MMAPLPSPDAAISPRGANGGSANGSSGSSSSSSSKNSVQKYLTNCKSLYSCIYCRTHLANHDELVSRSFQGNHGRAYLFNSVINVSCGQAVQRELNTGSHAVADIFCGNCQTTLGWKYEKAYVETQKYKEGKYIIELAHVVRENRHLELDKGEMFFGRQKNHTSPACGNHHQSSLTPPSLSHGWSSAASSSNEEVLDDEELMFPFYDDLCSSRSSYPSSLSSSHHNRMRRSLYLDSTPYDWKHSTASPSASSSANANSNNNHHHHHHLHHQSSPQQQQPTTLASSLGSSSGSSSPSTSSSSETSPGQHLQKSYHSNKISAGDSSSNNSNNINDINIARNNRDSTSERYGNNNEQEADVDNDDETQFKFEDDKPDSVVVVSEATARQPHGQANEKCDQLDSGVVDVSGGSGETAGLSSVLSAPTDEVVDRQSAPVDASGDSDEANDVDGGNNDTGETGSGSISLDDEEFYDCYTDHDVQNLMVASDSTSTLKIVEQ